MRIVFLMPSYYPDSFGGAERQTRILTRSLRDRGAAITILAPTLRPDAAGVVEEPEGRVVRLLMRNDPALGGRYVVSMLHFWIRALLWLARHRRTYDVIAIQHLRLHAWPGIVAGQLFGKLLSAKLGRGGAHIELRRLPAQKLPFGKLVVALARRSRLVFVANSSEIAGDLADLGIPASRVARVPNGVECPPEPRSAFSAPDGARVFVYAGRLATEKRVDRLIEAFRIFAADQPATLRIFGDGPEKARLLALAAGLPAVRFMGVTDDRDAIYGDAAFMILPSDSEGMSNTLLEAMAYGAVPIITDVSGAGDLVVSGRSGIMLAANTREGILEGLFTAARLDPAAWGAMSAEARQRMCEKHAIPVVADAYLRLYRAMADDRLNRVPPALGRGIGDTDPGLSAHGGR
ncbi:glycosyltransferase family 4 protein [Methylobacterium sp. J-070]|uniref:glycosyltransferase family 4 protein n=1 Tax=Methylobacterium sp. J-070 TaxID=2836650 RepID=UPI001FB9141D|nr:glycosyltransferase family 4 protein [Methylobacterium sp. J-070]MCJ2053861.1 glycosyltransferase family 4 protein [Methylobacterium sp. J-070]